MIIKGRLTYSEPFFSSMPSNEAHASFNWLEVICLLCPFTSVCHCLGIKILSLIFVFRSHISFPWTSIPAILIVQVLMIMNSTVSTEISLTIIILPKCVWSLHFVVVVVVGFFSAQLRQQQRKARKFQTWGGIQTLTSMMVVHAVPYKVEL